MDLQQIHEWVTANGLKLYPEKSHVILIHGCRADILPPTLLIGANVVKVVQKICFGLEGDVPLCLICFIIFVSILHLIDYYYFFLADGAWFLGLAHRCGWRVFIGACAFLCCAISGPG
jgi:hypothetical protein